MDPAIAQRFNGWLAPREVIRWTGRPIQGFTLQQGDLFTIPFSVLWLSFAIFWLSGVIGTNAPLFFPIFGSVFVIVGLNFVLGRYISDAYLRTKTFYALTESRVLILGGWRGIDFVAVEIRNVSEVHVLPANGDRGTIVFGPRNHAGLAWSRRQVERAPSPEFVKIDRVQEVYAVVQRLRTEPRSA